MQNKKDKKQDFVASFLTIQAKRLSAQCFNGNKNNFDGYFDCSRKTGKLFAKIQQDHIHQFIFSHLRHNECIENKKDEKFCKNQEATYISQGTTSLMEKLTNLNA